MAKKSRRRKTESNPIQEEVVSSFLEDMGAGEASTEITGIHAAAEPMEAPLHARLELIREGAQKNRSEVAETIAQLEEWRAEIDATLAYLRGSK